jgi:hypothetical protein
VAERQRRWRRLLGCAPKRSFGPKRRAPTCYICGVACAAKPTPRVSLSGGPGPGGRESASFGGRGVEMAGDFGGKGWGWEEGPGGPTWQIGLSGCGTRPRAPRGCSGLGPTGPGVESSEEKGSA